MEKAVKKALGKVQPKQHARGFTDFVREQGVVGLAIGLVLGTQVKVLVDQLIASFIDPLLGLFIGGGGSLREKMFHLRIERFGKGADFAWGAFLYVMIDFLLIAAIVYLVFKALKLDRLDKKRDK